MSASCGDIRPVNGDDKQKGPVKGEIPPVSAAEVASTADLEEPVAPTTRCGRRRRGTTASDVDSDAAADGADGRKKDIYIARSMRLNILNWYQLASLWVLPWGLPLFGCICLATLFHDARERGVTTDAVVTAVSSTISPAHEWFWANLSVLVVLAVLLLLWIRQRKTRSVYLMEHAEFQPPADWKVSHDDIVEIMKRSGFYGEEQLDFMRRVLVRSETGQATHWPPGVTKLLRAKPGDAEADESMSMAREEARAVIFGTLDELLRKTGLQPKEIDFLIINCSLFAPTPSLCAMVANAYGLRRDCRSYNLGGMGCSAGVISVDLAKQLLTNSPGSRAVVISTENLTQQLYHGKQKSMLLQNTLFRCGAAAILLSSKLSDGLRAKYKLLHTVRTQNAQDEAYGCVYQTEDDEGFRGIRLSKAVTTIAGRALKDNLTLLGPHVLPLREQLSVVYTEVLRRGAKWLRAYAARNKWSEAAVARLPSVPPMYVPDFKRGLHHFCIHAGGRAVIDGIEENLRLSPEDTAASRATLRDYGNTSSSSIWYELAALEDSGRMRAGHRVLQIAFGSGFKCNSAVWLRLRATPCVPRQAQALL